jgi:hypothetical protein
MAQIANISVADGKTTPETHVYSAIKSGEQALWRRTGVAGQPAVAMESVKTTAKLAVSANGVNKVDIEIVVPVLEQAASGAASGYVAPPALAHELRGKITLFAHQRSDAAGRKDLRVLLSNLLKDAQIIDLIDNLTPPN